MTKRTISRPSRRGMLQAGLAIVAGAAIADQAMAQEQAQKIDKKLVMYQDQPKDGQQCSMCAQFQPPNACKIVGGEISPNGWCAAFAPKQS